MKSFLRFFSLAVLILGLAYAYLGFSLAGGSVWGWIVLAVPFAAILAMPLLVWGRDRSERARLKDVTAHAAYTAMGVLTYLFLFTVIRDFLHLIGLPRFRDLDVFVASFLALAAGAWIALRGPRVKRIELLYSDIAPELDGLRLVQLTDLHIGGVITRAYVRRVVDMVNELNADLLALTGDIGDGDAESSRPLAEPLGDLQPKGRVFYVSGNHEYYWKIDEWTKCLRQLGCEVLTNAARIYEYRGRKVWVAGIPDKMAETLGAHAKPDLTTAMAGGEDADFKVLLSHRPGPARRASQLGFDLQLSGHTHGGQFFPWTLVVRRFHEFHAGLHAVGRMWIYVSHGTGTWGPPLRLGTTPEITLLTVRSV